MGFREDLQRTARAVAIEHQAIVRGASHALYDAIRDGSPVTGAPGQPRHTDELYDSWTITETPDGATIESSSDHAIFVEENVRQAHFKNGGAHSVALSVTAFGSLLANASRRGA